MSEQPPGEWCLPEADLRALATSVPMFEGIDMDSVMALLRQTRALELEPGQMLVENGSPATTAYLVVDGEIEVIADTEDTPILIAVRHRGDLVGEMALLTRSRRNASLRAKGHACLLEIESDLLHTWLHQNPAAILNVLRTAVARMKSAETDMVQHQQLASLGTLAAGLAHELNNPASALLRSAGQLSGAVQQWEQATWELGTALSTGPNPASTLRESAARREPGERPDPFTLSERETEIQSWLAARGIPSPWEIAPVLAEHGWTPGSLDESLADVPDPLAQPAVRWIAEGARVQELLDSLRLSAGVIGNLVAAVKSYSRLDEAPVQRVDLHEGIEQSLTILKYQLRGIQVVRNYAEDIPPVIAHATQLNQLWTNLIDNAAGAMNGSGTLTISTSTDDGWVQVVVEDTGPGIPRDVRERLFEPFFTTKPPGQGTGLGLAIGYSTVRNHEGTIEVDSEPGRTRFTVRLPLRRTIPESH